MNEALHSEMGDTPSSATGESGETSVTGVTGASGALPDTGHTTRPTAAPFPADVTIGLAAHNSVSSLPATFDALRAAGCPPSQITLVDVALEAGIQDRHVRMRGAAPADYDLDGDMDVFLSSTSTSPLTKANLLNGVSCSVTFQKTRDWSPVELRETSMSPSRS